MIKKEDKTEVGSDAVLADYDWELWDCLAINTHQSKTVITAKILDEIKGVDGVITASVIGNYGMEAIVVTDVTDCDRLKEDINALIFKANAPIQPPNEKS